MLNLKEAYRQQNFFNYLRLFIIGIVLSFFLFCANAPESPYQPNNTKMKLILESSDKRTDEFTITDTVGKRFRIGVISNMPYYIDSVRLSIFSKSTDLVERDTFFLYNTKVDTQWCNFTFSTEGARTIISRAFIKGGAILSDSANISIFALPKDSLMTDSEPPIFTYVSGPKSNARLLTATDTLVYTIIDPSGVDSVYWTLNGVFSGTIQKQANNNYKVPFELTKFNNNRIVIQARDGSINKNRDSVAITLIYNTKPGSIVTVSPTNKAVGIDTVPTFSWDGGDDADSDTVYYRVLYGTASNDLNLKTREITNKTISLSGAEKLKVYTKYYWKVIAYSKVFPDSVQGSLDSFTTISSTLSITRSPSSVTINEGDSLNLTVAAVGTPPPTSYQWYCNDTVITNATNATYTKSNSKVADAGRYYAIVSNEIGDKATSATAVVTVLCKYSLKYSANGGSGTVPATTTHLSSTQVTIAAIGSLSKTGYSFLSWNTDSMGTGIDYAPSSTITIQNGNITLYARWTKNKYRVKYNGNGNDAGSVPGSAEYDYGATITLAEKENLVLTGYTFIGWNTKSDGSGTGYTANATFVLGPDSVTLYAKWKNPDGMAKIPAKDRSFQMGSNNGDNDERPVHTVEFSHDYWMDTTEVTQGQYCRIMSAAYSNFQCPTWKENAPDLAVGANYPAFNTFSFYEPMIFWFDAALYCNARTKATGSIDTVYSYTSISGIPGDSCVLNGLTIDLSKHGFRLPTEAEWEFAYRAGATTDYFWGKNYNPYPLTVSDSNEMNRYCIWSKNSGSAINPDSGKQMQPVAQTQKNAFNLYDMSGNLSEFCNDWYDNTYFRISPQKDPSGPNTGEAHVFRGGCWNVDAAYQRSAIRNGNPYVWGIYLGFRVCLPVQ
jgi:uncharacterized repeat protein (TIGR02543 family)